MERAVVLSRGEGIEVGDLPPQVTQGEGGAQTLSIPIGTSLADIESMVIRETLATTKGDKKLAAQLLGIAVRTIYRKT
jgi:two-component system response regulator HydG